MSNRFDPSPSLMFFPKRLFSSHISIRHLCETGANPQRGGHKVPRWVGQENEKREKGMKMEIRKGFIREDPW
ncbi:MAG: hypothetical protein PVI20_13330, partial [Desulfobacteraceae bacterium]